MSSIEAMGEPAALKGRTTVAGKMRAWGEAREVHGFSVTGPFVNEDQLALSMTIGAGVRATGQRMNMLEVALYTVQEEKIVEERFFS